MAGGGVPATLVITNHGVSLMNALKKYVMNQNRIIDRMKSMQPRSGKKPAGFAVYSEAPGSPPECVFLTFPVKNKAVIEVRDGIAIDREKDTVANKYDFEVVPAGSSFRLEIATENLNEQERGLLWLGVKGLTDGMIQIGGFKGRGLGQVALENIDPQWVCWDAGNTAPLRDYLLHGKASPVEDKDAECWLESLLDEMEEGYNA